MTLHYLSPSFSFDHFPERILSFLSILLGKVRRQAKTVKPKKMAKMDGHFVVNAACNNGTTALVTREGELFMFGKDTSSCDPATGESAIYLIFFVGKTRFSLVIQSIPKALLFSRKMFFFIYIILSLNYFIFSGLVSELKDTQITQIALGKAHAVALTSKGHIYTFGINNKGQCGREFTPLVKDCKF